MVEGMKDYAIREAFGRLIAWGELPDGLGCQGSLAHAPWTADGDHSAGLEVIEERRQLILSADKMLGPRWLLQGQAKLGGFVISDTAGEDRTIRIDNIGLRALHTLASLVGASSLGH